MSEIYLRSEKSFEPTPILEKNNKVVDSIFEPIPKPDSSVVVEAKKEKKYVPLIPFPQRVLKTKKMDEDDRDKEILDVFRKVAVNIPLLNVIKQVPKYAKFLKYLCIHKTILKGNERVNM